MDLDSAYRTWRCQGSSWLAQALSSNELPTPIVGLFHHKVETMSGVEDGNTIFGTRHVTRCWGVGWNSHNILHSNPKTSKTLEPWQCWWGKFDVRSCDTFNIHSHIPTSFNESILRMLWNGLRRMHWWPYYSWSHLAARISPRRPEEQELAATGMLSHKCWWPQFGSWKGNCIHIFDETQWNSFGRPSITQKPSQKCIRKPSQNHPKQPLRLNNQSIQHPNIQKGSKWISHGISRCFFSTALFLGTVLIPTASTGSTVTSSKSRPARCHGQQAMAVLRVMWSPCRWSWTESHGPKSNRKSLGWR